jgi:predicted DNA-binding transcriptional regulator AlpA
LRTCVASLDGVRRLIARFGADKLKKILRNHYSFECAHAATGCGARRSYWTARLVEVSPDSVGLTDIAELVGVSRQNMRQLSLAHAKTFPTPFHSGNVELWHLAHVLEWLEERGAYRIEQPLLDVARVAMKINLVKESTLIQGEVRREVRNLVA